MIERVKKPETKEEYLARPENKITGN